MSFLTQANKKLFLSIFLFSLISFCVSHKRGICILTPDNNSTLYGNVTFDQETESGLLRVDYNIQNITGIRGFHIHQNPNITGGCLSTGSHYNPTNTNHGGPESMIRHVGDFGNLQASNNQIKQTVYYNGTSLWGNNSILNRACVLHENPDDLGLGGNDASLLNGNAGTRIGCGVLNQVAEDIILPVVGENLKYGLKSKLITGLAIFIGILLI